MRAVIVAVLLLALSSPAFAAKKRKKPPAEPDKEQVVTVPVPVSEIHLEPLRYVPPRPVEFEFSASSWEPRSFDRTSYTGQRSGFVKNGLPAISLNRLGEISAWDNGIVLSSKLGATYLGLERSATPQIGNVSTGSSSENINLFMGRLGAEGSWARVLPWGLEPSVGFALLPTWVTAQKSIYENGVSAFGVPVEGTFGILWRTSARASLLRGDMSVGVAGQAVNGSVGGSSLNGFGVQGEFRISL